MSSDFVTPKFQVSPTSVSRTSKNGCKFFFYYSRSGLVAWFYVCFDIYNPLFYVISVFFVACAFLLFVFCFFMLIFCFCSYIIVQFRLFGFGCVDS